MFFYAAILFHLAFVIPKQGSICAQERLQLLVKEYRSQCHGATMRAIISCDTQCENMYEYCISVFTGEKGLS